MAPKVKPGASKLIDAYIAKLPPFSRALCTELRAVARKAAPKLQEDWKWSAPCFTGESIVCSMAAFKAHVSFDFWHGTQMSDKHGLFNQRQGNKLRALRLVAGDKVPKTKLADYIREAVKIDAEVAAAPAKRKPARAPIKVVVPPSLKKCLALKKHAKARTFFDGLPPSEKREYCNWIAEAKREETAERRLAKTLEQLGRGERRHDKYRC